MTTVKEHRSFLDTPIEYCKGVGPVRGDLLKKELKVFTFEDLLKTYPFRYIDKTRFSQIKDLNDDSGYVQIKGIVSNFSLVGTGRNLRLVAVLSDNTGSIDLVWFGGGKWVKDKLESNCEFVAFGKPSLFNGKLNMTHPELARFEKLLLTDKVQYIAPFYSSTEKMKAKGLDSRGLSKIVETLLHDVDGKIPEILSDEILNIEKLPSRENAIKNIHFPSDFSVLAEAQKRLKFDEFFWLQLRLLRLKVNRNQKQAGHIFTNVGSLLNQFYTECLPFELTDAQKRVIKEIRQDMRTGRQMNRLLQGDVGSGKTLVALMSMLIALDNGFQCCLMAPTEILANQHFQTISSFVAPLGIRVVLLTGSTKTSARKEMAVGLASGEIKILIGTHALIEDTVTFNNLGLAVIDEQHRFGVAQRAKLWKKNHVPPHILVMTATPIPRTLAMTLYGDLDVSVIDELPKNRKPIKTLHFFDSNRLKVWGFIKQQIKVGRQIYIVYPLINESETLDLKHLLEGYDAVVRDFPLPEYAVSMVHGQMKPKEKDAEMARFVKGETNILVATTVIEVGVDVPNATVMIIENAERFGLSQLHQLRGRVGRGAEQSYCLLMTSDKISADAKLRIQTMVSTTDGFKISETDLKLRGPGNIEGLEQSGITGLQLADIINDEEILLKARKAAMELLSRDPELIKDENRPVRQFIINENKRRGNWGMIS